MPVDTPLQVPSSSMKHTPYNGLAQNLMHLSPSVFTPHSTHSQPLSIPQPAPILSSTDSPNPSFQSLSSVPPPVLTPRSTYSLFDDNPLSANIPSSCNPDLSSVQHLEQLFQNLSLSPPPAFNPHFAQPQSQYSPRPSTISVSGDIGLLSGDDDDIEMELSLGGEPMDTDSVDEVMQDNLDTDDPSSYRRTLAMSRNSFGILRESQPVLYPETFHPLPQLPTVYDDICTPNPYPERPVIDTAHAVSLYLSTPFPPSCNEKETTSGFSINDTTLVRPTHLLDHISSSREVEEQTALKWFAKEISRVRSVDSRHLVHATHSSAPLHLSPDPWRGVTTVEDATRRMQTKAVLYRQQSHLTRMLLGDTISKAKDKSTVRRFLPMRRPDCTRNSSSLLSPEYPDNSSRSLGGWKGNRVVEKGDRPMKSLRVAAQVIPAAFLKISASVLKVPATTFMTITSTVVKTYFALMKGLKLTSTSRAKPLPEVIVIDDD
ncbi:hypothetical protein C0992_003522 [Termitomyces sp. T32_za158]|nr:hypothetical protein C0992_003522 [Termitomyces sp. T32_za158]